MAVLLSALNGSAVERALPQDAYVWQRVWTPELGEALARTAPLIAGWRVLVAEWAPDGRLALASPDWTALTRCQRPVVAVIRIDFRRALPAPDAVARLAASLPVRAVAGIELDADLPTRRLDEYRRFLHALRPMLPRGQRLSITALPDWLRVPTFVALGREVDQVVLQLHAVDDPRRGLFDTAEAVSRIARMAAVSPRPFLVALPAYGVRVVQGADGSVLATEAERPALAGDAGQELSASPEEVAGVVARLEANPPRGLAGLAWFRLPTRLDRRSWSLATWAAVLRRATLRPHLVLQAVRRADGLAVLRVVNEGNADAQLPARIAVADCLAADGAGPYRMARDPSVLVRQGGDALLRAGEAVTVGWTRCAAPEESFFF